MARAEFKCIVVELWNVNVCCFFFLLQNNSAAMVKIGLKIVTGFPFFNKLDSIYCAETAKNQ